MASLTPVLKQAFFDLNGNPLAGGKLYSYLAGTTTPVDTYSDSTGTLNTNPVILDSTGRANVWAVPGSYKFELRNSSDVTQWTTDNVLIQAEIPTLSKGDILGGGTGGTLSKTAAGSNGQYLAAYDADSAGIRFRSFLSPTYQRFTSGSSSYKGTTVFEIATGSATAGDVYTNNGASFTVVDTVSFGTILYALADGLPLSSGTLTRSSGSGDFTITFRAYRRPIALEVECVGAGGGGGGAGTGGGTGGTGGATTFNTTLVVANAGTGGIPNGVGGTGGTTSFSTGAYLITQSSGVSAGGGSTSGNTAGSNGGASPLGGAGPGGSGGFSAGLSGIDGTGSGGGGGGCTTAPSAPGGASGGYVKVFIPSPAISYPYTIGNGGIAGSAGTGGGAGGTGAKGGIVVKEIFQ